MTIAINEISDETVAAFFTDDIKQGISKTFSIPVRLVIGETVIGATIVSIRKDKETGVVVIGTLTESVGTTDSYKSNMELTMHEFESFKP